MVLARDTAASGGGTNRARSVYCCGLEPHGLQEEGSGLGRKTMTTGFGFCPNCGTPRATADQRFCPSCGAATVWSAPTPPPPASSPGATWAPAQAPLMPARGAPTGGAKPLVTVRGLALTPRVALIGLAIVVVAGALLYGLGAFSGSALPGQLQGRWITTLDTGDQQAFVFRGGSIEFDYITPAGITSTWTTNVTKSFTTSRGVNIIETDGPNTFAWYVSGSTLYLDWGVPESDLLNLDSMWWQKSGDIYTKY